MREKPPSGPGPAFTGLVLSDKSFITPIPQSFAQVLPSQQLHALALVSPTPPPVCQSWNSVGNRGLQQERLLGLLSNMVILQAFSGHAGMWVLLLREFASNFSPPSRSHSAPHIPVHKRLPQKGQKRAYLGAFPSWF